MEKKIDKYNRKFTFFLLLIPSIIGIVFTYSSIIEHKYFFFTFIAFLITTYMVKFCIFMLYIFMHGVASNDFDEKILGYFDTWKSEKSLISKDVDKKVFIELKQLIKTGSPYYLYDYALIIQAICNLVLKEQNSPHKIKLNFILRILKTINNKNFKVE